MPIIQFDVLIPAEPARQLSDVFTNAINILVKKGRLAEGSVTHEADVSVDEQVVEQLGEVYRRDHGVEMEGGSVHRYLIEASGEHVSYNQLAMALSRILTPEADLPADPVALERETAYETPSAYPWTVEIRR
ncbi:hypothetical protein [Corynebacterium guangdongense]|uniref:Uncharacterized protein n=1 Tax=Corynebacterium guangdongense TaxID=1783348 RepID=A0ABU1ZXK5_9CORY|nr:hypothetical protein [Corynebacterium guangdongense]MDR7329664.1 hypothetical protein [Corynebacterium guangdongense]WJZ18228.1 hypothetical protein CGUA_08335 [Corynebacterium guangdongense]